MKIAFRRARRLTGVALHVLLGGVLVLVLYPVLGANSRLEVRRWWCANLLALLGILFRTTIGTFGGVNDHLIHTFQSGFQIFWCAQLAIRHKF